MAQEHENDSEIEEVIDPGTGGSNELDSIKEYIEGLGSKMDKILDYLEERNHEEYEEHEEHEEEKDDEVITDEEIASASAILGV